MTVTELKKEFIKRFGGNESEVRVFASPGRVNLIGEHIDYNGGSVLPAAITLGTTIAARPRADRKLVMEATDLNDHVIVELDKIDDYKDLWWGNYQAGIAKELMIDGVELVGADMLYDDTLPHGGGLSSSAAIEVATALTLTVFANEKAGIDENVDMIKMALIGQRAERNYAGVSCGIMDQFASAMGKENCAVLVDCSTLKYKHVPLDLGDCSIVITNTNKKRSLITSKYNERCEECAKALADIQTVLPDIKLLGELTTEQFEANKSAIKCDICRKRAEHVVYECDRVARSVEALQKGDIEGFGKLLNASGDSLRDLYEVTGEELDTLVSAARSVKGCVGSRMTGAGFGGCTVSIVKNDAIEEFKTTVHKLYTDKIGYEPSFYITTPGDGGREIK